MQYALVVGIFVKAVILADADFITAKGPEMASSYGHAGGSWVQAAGLVGKGYTYEGGQFLPNSPGHSVSGATPAISVSAGGTLELNLDGDGARTIAFAASSSGTAVAADIQAKMRALTANNPVNAAAYSGFSCVYNSIMQKYVLTVPTWEGGTVVVSGGTAAASLKLGAANGGTEVTGNGESGG